MEEIITMKNGQGWTVKKWHVIISIILLLIVITGSVISPFVWKASVDTKIGQNEGAIKELRSNNASLISLSKEIKLNLKILMTAQGIKYIEDTDKSLGTR